MTIVSALGRWKKEDWEFKASLNSTILKLDSVSKNRAREMG